MCLERLNEASTHTYLWAMRMMLLFYTVIKDTQCEFGQPRHHFQKSLFCSVYTETQPRSFQTKTGSAAFSKVSVSRVENAGVV